MGSTILSCSEQVTSRGQAAAHLALQRNTVAAWLRCYRDEGLGALLAYKEAGAQLASRHYRRPCSRRSQRVW